jgi:glutamyl-tRNA synthetase
MSQIQNNICVFDKNSQVRTRIAPSPTGALHIGTARTALFNYLFARKNGGVFILRIEDTDLERSDAKWEEDIFEGLKWLRIDWNEFYKQSERTNIYEKHIKRLLKEGRAFWCYHSKEELEEERRRQMKRKENPKHVCGFKRREPKAEDQSHRLKIKDKGIIRLDTPNKIVKFNDLIRGKIEFDAGLLGDISIAKDEKTPLYNLAAAVDDYEMKISHVIRGEDHISNTPKQILIREALGLTHPQYAHLPLILGPDRSKLSKRHGATSISEYRKEGYLPEAMINFMAMLGWNPGDEREILNLEDLIKEFSLDKVQKGGAVFNINKLDWINGHYIRKKPVKELAELILKAGFLQIPKSKTQIKDKLQISFIEKIVELEQSRLKKLSEIGERTDYFFSNPEYGKDLLKWKKMSDEEIRKSLEKSREIILNIPDSKFTIQDLEDVFLKEARKFKDRGELLWPLRVALSGKKESPSPFEIAAILGKEKVLKRLYNALSVLKSE